jgi:hypothetical protein
MQYGIVVHPLLCLICPHHELRGSGFPEILRENHMFCDKYFRHGQVPKIFWAAIAAMDIEKCV